MIINIHGFGSSGKNSKYKWLSENIKEHDIYSPTFYYERENAAQIFQHLIDKIKFLTREKPEITKDVFYDAGLLVKCLIRPRILNKPIEDHRNIYVVGSSLGGFFARCLNIKFPYVTSILINPSLAPFLNLRKYGVEKSELYQYVRLLGRYYNADEEGKENLYVILGDSDEVIDHDNVTKLLLPYKFSNHIFTIKGGAHQMRINGEIANILRSVIKPPKIKEEGKRQIIGIDDIRLS